MHLSEDRFHYLTTLYGHSRSPIVVGLNRCPKCTLDVTTHMEMTPRWAPDKSLPHEMYRYNKTWRQLLFFQFLVLKIYLLGVLLLSWYQKCKKGGKSLKAVSVCIFFYVIGNYDSWIPSAADLFLKPIFRWRFSTKVLLCSFPIFPKLRTCAQHRNPCACHNSKALGHVISLPADSPDRLPWHWQGAELCSKNGCGHQQASHSLLTLWGLGYGLTGPKLPGSDGIPFLTTQGGLCSQIIQWRGEIQQWA